MIAAAALQAGRNLGLEPVEHQDGRVSMVCPVCEDRTEQALEVEPGAEPSCRNGCDRTEILERLSPAKDSRTVADWIVGEPMDPLGGWPELGARELPDFPVHALPDDARQFVEAISEEAQTPTDLAAMAVLTVLSAAAMGRAKVDCGSWTEELPIYAVTGLPSGERKSAVLQAAAAPLRDLERERAEEAAPVVRELRAKRDVLEVRRRKLVKESGEAKDDDKRKQAEAELAELDELLADIGEPVPPRLLADDMTPEAMGGLLAQHGQIAVIAAESAFLDNVAGGRYSETGSNLHLLCSAYSGEPSTIDRRNRDPELIDRPLITVGLVVQPHVVAALVSHTIARAQGLVARFCYSMPTTQLGRRDIDAPKAPAEVHERWAKCVRRAADTADNTDKAPHIVGSVSVSHNTENQIVLSLSNRACEDYRALRKGLEPKLSETGELRSIADWANRHPGRIARIAGLLHLAAHLSGKEVSGDTMADALAIGDYLLAHGIAALTGLDPDARRALGWLTARNKPTVTVRELHRGPLGGRSTADDATALAESLEQYGALRPSIRDDHTGPGKPSRVYEVNPAILRHADNADNIRAHKAGTNGHSELDLEALEALIDPEQVEGMGAAA
jgi:replicative DNA helicase